MMNWRRAVWEEAQMMRRVLNFISAFSLVLSALIGALCVRSYHVRDDFFRLGGPITTVSSDTGWVEAEREWPMCGNWGDVERNTWFYSVDVPQHRAHKASLTFSTLTRGWRLEVPYWVAGMATLLPAVIIVGGRHPLRLRRRRRPGLCRRCGYDLRATPERCPECGECVVDSPPVKKAGWADQLHLWVPGTAFTALGLAAALIGVFSTDEFQPLSVALLASFFLVPGLVLLKACWARTRRRIELCR